MAAPDFARFSGRAGTDDRIFTRFSTTATSPHPFFSAMILTSLCLANILMFRFFLSVFTPFHKWLLSLLKSLSGILFPCLILFLPPYGRFLVHLFNVAPTLLRLLNFRHLIPTPLFIVRFLSFLFICWAFIDSRWIAPLFLRVS